MNLINKIKFKFKLVKVKKKTKEFNIKYYKVSKWVFDFVKKEFKRVSCLVIDVIIYTLSIFTIPQLSQVNIPYNQYQQIIFNQTNESNYLGKPT